MYQLFTRRDATDLDDAVELRASVSVTILTRAELREVSSSLGHVLVVQAHVDLACDERNDS